MCRAVAVPIDLQAMIMVGVIVLVKSGFRLGVSLVGKFIQQNLCSLQYGQFALCNQCAKLCGGAQLVLRNCLLVGEF